MIIRNQIIEQVLDLIEDKETKLLIWGIVDISLTKNEIDECTITVIDKFDDLNPFEDDPDKIFDDLIARKLIFYIDDEEQYLRSRMSETLRLLYHLRQILM